MRSLTAMYDGAGTGPVTLPQVDEVPSVPILSRPWLGLGALGIGLGCSVLAPVLAAQAAAAPIALASWAQWLQNVANFTRVIELGAFIFGAYQFWASRRERRANDGEAARRAQIDANYQAWQVINSAQGKGGSGGRVEALGALLRNGVSLAGIGLDDAWLEGVALPEASLVRGSLQRANLTRANLAGANLEGADLRGAELIGANLTGTNLRGANVADTRLSGAILDGADLTDVVGWAEIRSISHASIDGVRQAPTGFVEFARGHGAVDRKTPRRADDDDDLGYSRSYRTI